VLAIQKVPQGDETGAVNPAILLKVARSPVFLGFCLAQALYVGAEVGFASWLPTYFRDSLVGGIAWEGVVVTIFWIAMTVGRVGVGPLIGRIPILRFVVVLTIGGIIGSVLVTIASIPLAAVGCVAWTGLCFSGVFGLILAEAGARYPSVSGSVFGAVTAAGGVGGAILPWSIALLAGAALNWRASLLLVPASMTALAVVILLLGRTGKGQ